MITATTQPNKSILLASTNTEKQAVVSFMSNSKTWMVRHLVNGSYKHFDKYHMVIEDLKNKGW